MISSPFEVYTDGSSLRNPGAAGLAYVIRYFELQEGSDLPEAKVIEGSQGFRLSTNNRMEVMAALWAMRTILQNIQNGTFEGARQVNIFSDSAYLVDAINQNWLGKWIKNNWMTSGFQGRKPKPVQNKDLWDQMIELRNQYQDMGLMLTFNKVQGHAGNEFNERADKLAVEASNGTNHIIDEMYEKSVDSLNRR